MKRKKRNKRNKRKKRKKRNKRKKKRRKKSNNNNNNRFPGNKSMNRTRTKYVGCYTVVWMCFTSQ